ncbi:MAG: nickel-dependent lactate racemase [Candidatus Bathyarchaeota archaeon]|nr:MAG: nickel-dependent lactate racemase [Candidatus Bathyarchaeota archaeon]
MRTRTIALPYGRGYIDARIPERYLLSIVLPKTMQPLPNPSGALERALREPINSTGLCEMAQGCKDICVIVSDSTRPTPSGLIVQAALRDLKEAGIHDGQVKVVVATGLHRPCTEEELRERLDVEIQSRISVINHDARDDSNLVEIGETSHGTPIWLNKTVHESDLVISDGYIEPHFFAGYTGGGKNILPGVAGYETIKANHRAAMIDHPNARAGILDGNPVYEDIVEGARLGGLGFSINVTLDPQKRISGIFAGEFKKAHRAGSRFLDGHVRVETPEADIVVTTNGGYPLDRDLYQAVKGMTVAEAVVREGGVAIIASECIDGVGHPRFRELVERFESPREILEIVRAPGFFMVDQWEAQILARVLTRCEVICVTGIEPSVIRSMHMTPAKDIDEALSLALKILGRDPEIVVVPAGPSTIPYVQ